MEGGLEIVIPEERLHLLADPADQSEVVHGLLTARPETVGLGLCDDEVADSLGRALKEAGSEAYDPRGLLLGESMVAGFVAALEEVLGEASFPSVARLVRHPLFLGSLAKRSDKSGADLIAALDEFQAQHHPATLAAGKAMAEQSLVGMLLDEVERLLRPLRQVARARRGGKPTADDTLGKALERVLSRILGDGIEIDEGDLEYVSQLLEGATSLERVSGQRSIGDDLEVLSEVVGQARWYPNWRGDALVLDGWLESLWSPRSQMVVAGANEGTTSQERRRRGVFTRAIATDVGNSE